MYLCSENKGADQLCGYRAADLRRCFRICKIAGFLMTRGIFVIDGYVLILLGIIGIVVAIVACCYFKKRRRYQAMQP